MGNSKNKKVPKKRKSKKSNFNTSTSSSHQKENRPKNKVIKPDPNDTISMSKQLLQKRSNSKTKRQSTSQNETRICGNGKPLPSLADLEKMFEDSDGDEQSPQSPKTSTQPLETCSTPTPEEQKPSVISKDKLLSPSTINKISERMMDLITNITNPIELLEDVPPPPVIPPKKRKKTDVPYIVGCKDRPKVASKPNTNFCKGDDNYGVEASCDDLDDLPPTKRAKKSKIPTYSKSIFNAKTDEIVDRLTKDDAEGISDGSSDSNKTIEYDPTLFKSQRPHTFSPLPSTSRDNDTFIKNDELFNESLKENSDTKVTTLQEKENEVQIIDIPYDTITVDDVFKLEKPEEIQNNGNHIDTNDIEIIYPIKKEDHNNAIDTNHNDDDCIIVQSSTENNNHENSNQPIVIDDEYSDINLINDTYNTDPIEIIDLDVDDVIAQNKSILDKLKKYGTQKIDKINAVVNVPTTYRNTTASQPIVSSTPQKNSMLNNDFNRNKTQNIQNVCNSNTELTDSNTNIPNSRIESGNAIEKIVTNFFDRNQNLPRSTEATHSKRVDTGLFQTFIDTILNFTVRRTVPACVTSVTDKPIPVPTNHLPKIDNRTSNLTVSVGNPSLHSLTIPTVDLSSPSSNHEKQKTNNFTTRTPETPDTKRNLGECPICMDPLSSNGIASTICGHVFCLKCIQAAIKANGRKCPTCRKILKGAGGGYHQLYL